MRNQGRYRTEQHRAEQRARHCSIPLLVSRSDEMLVAPGSPHAHVANLERRRKRFYLEGESDRLPFVAPNPEMGGELGFQQETVWEQARERLISTGF